MIKHTINGIYFFIEQSLDHHLNKNEQIKILNEVVKYSNNKLKIIKKEVRK